MTLLPVIPADESSPIVYLNGEFIRGDQARISPSDSAFLTGLGIFETLKAVNGHPFAASRHYKRLACAATVMKLPIPGEEELNGIMKRVLVENGWESARLRVTITPETTYVSAGLLPTFPATAKVITVPFSRNENGALAGLKTVSYAENKVALLHAKAAGADEAIFANTAGDLCEGSMTNVFIVTNGKLITPSLDSGCLPGVTRALVVELAKENGLGCEEKQIPISKFSEALDEVFLTSSLREIQSVSEINGVKINQPRDGFARALQTSFAELVQKTMNP